MSVRHITSNFAAVALRAQSDLLNRINLIWVVQSPSQKYSRSLLTQITCISLAIPAHTQGAFRDRHERRAGMRWTRVALLTRALSCGRRSRVVLTPRRWRQVSQKYLRDDGGKKARSPGRARNKLLKPSRAGMPGDPGATVVTNACVLLPYTRGCGCNGHPAFPTPSLGERISFKNSGARASRDRECMFDECARHTLGRRRPRKRAIQYSEASVIEPRSCGVLDTPLEPVIGLAGGETRGGV
jgi:hypothetical protein